MTIHFQILGNPGCDNALYAAVDSGQSIYRLLFDCGENCLEGLSTSDVQALDAVFFSHFHFDHVGGFDSLLRRSFYRVESPLRIIGPHDTLRVIHHRLQGVTWNLVEGHAGHIEVTEIAAGRRRTYALKTGEQFATPHLLDDLPFDQVAIDLPEATVFACPLDHGIESMAYLVREKTRKNVDTAQAAKMGLPPGRWMQQLKSDDPGEAAIVVNDREYRLAELRSLLLHEREGDSLAYLTDFRLDAVAEERLRGMLHGVQTIVCENNYASADAALAEANYHMTSAGVARLAIALDPQRLILFHLSDRYTRSQWQAQLAEVAALFPRTEFPPHWFAS